MIRKMKDFWTSLDEMKTISKRELFLEMVAVALTGIVLGMLLTPKKTVTIGSNNNCGNGCNCGNSNGDEPTEDEEESVAK